ncbi:mannose-1-phosphate guanylyltransferase/mannose-6-phosphate isomerase [Pseudomonas protegens]|uniref:mannose-1-phosphate guanylyltransferase n=2 Tax=Pseudomonas protegens TaxID=380021 RepID=Q4K5D2_PSEF5|nr:mannose-1-phosphate guanylyltransferase/mannose-6-phosphate isomerase [Pseudomonas protegens]AAY94693.1 mannose-1-phosphate guanylyltransferase/mannose-6-phosphate isomerase [Pseudomonas protegens Pf-5]AVK73693.1 mannose-1-phosphate guanylyltransferase/mannose-6-phosphate isomerase [Pseudomonas protegens]PNV96692.1 mannose-1-phosphate guanylyltransferase/mannose-6-phosphate isomerase [Pseudomonas protegens]QEZ66450.1 mannose-1-phosphate guanylyltransferase/mannose-6-phosphate isomerase [Pseu
MSSLGSRSSTSIQPVILCGGSGTRLWPLSRQSYPKQFMPLLGGRSLLALTLERVSGLSSHPWCVASTEHRFLVIDAFEQCQLNGQVLLEPSARNTAAAIAVAALHAEDDALLLFCPADHYIPDAPAFVERVRQAQVAALDGALVTFGVFPTYPSSAYGYIEASAPWQDSGALHVQRFIEKPSATQAAELLLKGNMYWNAGIFLGLAREWRRALELHAPDILAACRDALREAESPVISRSGQTTVQSVVLHEPSFDACRSQSIDYAVMEHHRPICAVPFNGAWSDVGSWNAVADLSSADDKGNSSQGDAHLFDCQRTYVHAAGRRPVVALGLEDVCIVDTDDAVLVMPMSRAEDIKSVVGQLTDRSVAQALLHRRVARPWGWYDSLDQGERFQVKRIGVKPGASLSLQLHHHRAEHWTVVKGTAEITCGDRVFLLSENQSTYIPLGQRHRLHNPGKVELEIIEVQSGSYLAEDDIVRLEDNYGRTAPHCPGPAEADSTLIEQ